MPLKQHIPDFVKWPLRWLLIRLRLLKPRFGDVLRMSRGVIHVGANTGQERGLYGEYGLRVLWIEPIDKVFEELLKNISTFPKQEAFQALLTDHVGDKVTLRIANNGGESSSIFDFDEHKELWPEVGYCAEQTMATRTLDELIEREGLDVSDCNLLVMDVQGAELLVLKGAEAFLKQVMFIRLEAADFHAYQNAPLRSELTGHLVRRGFFEVAAEVFEARVGVGSCYDITYQRRLFLGR
jgi:FkbM family methyltransferase